MVEYVIMAALFAIALIVTVAVVRDAVEDGFQLVVDGLDGAVSYTLPEGRDQPGYT